MLRQNGYTRGVETFGEWLTAQLNERGWSGRQFATERLGVSHMTVYRWLRDEREPSRDDLRKIARALDLEPATVALAFMGLLPAYPRGRHELPLADAVHMAAGLVDAQLDAVYRWMTERYGADAAAILRRNLGH